MRRQVIISCGTDSASVLFSCTRKDLYYTYLCHLSVEKCYKMPPFHETILAGWGLKNHPNFAANYWNKANISKGLMHRNISDSAPGDLVVESYPHIADMLWETSQWNLPICMLYVSCTVNQKASFCLFIDMSSMYCFYLKKQGSSQYKHGLSWYGLLL